MRLHEANRMGHYAPGLSFRDWQVYLPISLVLNADSDLDLNFPSFGYRDSLVNDHCEAGTS